MSGACSTNGGEERWVQGFGGESEVKETLGRPRRKWEDNIKMGLREVGKEAYTVFIWLRVGTSGGLL